MGLDYWYFIFAFTGAVIGGLIIYLFLKSQTVKKSEYTRLHRANIDLEKEYALQNDRFENLRNSHSTISDQYSTLEQQYKELDREHHQSVLELEQKIEQLSDLFEENSTIKETLNENQKSLQETFKINAVQSSKISELKDKLSTQKEEIEQLHHKMQLEFKEIAQNLLEEKSKKFTEQNKTNIDQLLTPFNEKLLDLKKKVEETYITEAKERHSLQDHIKILVELNQQISRDANNLTQALKGQNKTQGDWGEMILEKILQDSGLVKGREYFSQETIKDEDGKNKRPDFIIKYPDNRHVIIDSKVSLKNYEEFVSAEDPDIQKMQLEAHYKSVKKHIDQLSDKKYDEYDLALDFVMLFIPIEPAYMAVMQYDQKLWSYAYKKRVLLISPTNLIAALKMLSDLWKREYQNQNAIEIAEEAAKMHSKFILFIDALEDARNNLRKAAESQDIAMKRLHSGKGNLISRAAKFKTLGVKTKKSIDKKYLLKLEEE